VQIPKTKEGYYVKLAAAKEGEQTIALPAEYQEYR
jgi:hypothetical protein